MLEADSRTGCDLLTLAQSAIRLSISPRTLRQIIDRGELATIRVSPRRLAIHPDDLASYIASRRGKAE